MSNACSSDILIIGGGAAALSAALFSARRGLNALVVMKDLGGQMMTAHKITNYPGIDVLSGAELTARFKNQAEKYGAKFAYDEIVNCAVTNEEFTACGISTTYRARTVILAFGLTPRNLDLETEKKFWNRGLYHSLPENLNELKGKQVAVVGGGNAAIENAVQLSAIDAQVTLIHRQDKFRAEEALLNKLQTASGNVRLLLNAVIKNLEGNERLESIIVETPEGQKQIPAFALFVNIGYHTKTDWLADLVSLNQQGEILIDRDCCTKTPGLFAAGDCTDIRWKQIPVSSGEGVKAALSAYQYLLQKDGKRGATIDWGGA